MSIYTVFNVNCKKFELKSGLHGKEILHAFLNLN